ncbi:MAG: DUF2339 domain-containing protein [Pseudohongiellaceae bacterium]
MQTLAHFLHPKHMDFGVSCFYSEALGFCTFLKQTPKQVATMELFGILLVIALPIGAVLGWVAYFRVGNLQREVKALESHLQLLLQRLEKAESVVATNKVATNEVATNEAATAEVAPNEDVKPAEESIAAATLTQFSSKTEPANPESQNVWRGDSALSEKHVKPESTPAPAGFHFFENLRDQWMVWLGGLSVGLAGIFMVRYSMEQGLLGPAARISLSLFAGVGLHALAEWGRRRNKQQFNALAALAGGASIILFSALLASLFLYQLFPPGVVFAALLAIALGTMALSLLHGPVLAILGILAAYVIPALVDTGSESVSGLYVYSLIITSAALLLMRYVYRPWLWAGVLVGSLGWWFITIDTYSAAGLRGYYLAAMLYLFLAIPHWDWRLSKVLPAAPLKAITNETSGVLSRLLRLWLRGTGTHLPKSLSMAPGSLTLTLLVLAFAFTIAVEQRLQGAIYQWTPFIGILLVAAGAKKELLKFVALSLFAQGAAWLSLGLSAYDGIRLEGLVGPEQYEFMRYGAWMAFVYTALSLRNLFTSTNRNLCCAIAIISPLVWLSLAYLLVSDLSESVSWGAVAIGLGLFYLMLAIWRLRLDQEKSAQRSEAERDYFAVWLMMAGHFAYSLAVAIMVREAGLTLALSAQLLSVAWLIHRYNPPKLGLLLKLILAVIVARLTLNPWLLTYPADVHWSLWTFGGATLFAAIGAWRLKENTELGKWLELASLHLLVLTLWAEVRYYLYDGHIFMPKMEFLEFSINTVLWSSLALVYYLRHKASANLKPLYLLASKVLLTMGLFSYLTTLTFLNPFWTGEVIGQTPIFNILLLSFAMPVVLGLLLIGFYDPSFKSKVSGFTALAGFVFVNVEIRHLWNGELSVLSETTNGELYTYTLVWLFLAISCLLAGSLRFGQSVYRGGFALLMVVIAKIFLLDMADLEGLLRVASFMGLGLSLLGLAYLYQRFNLSPSAVSKGQR